MKKSENSKNWFVYILECGDDSLYTGCTNDLKKRLESHAGGKGAKYTRSHLPVTLIYSEELADRSLAQKREAEIKQLTRLEKLKLVKDFSLRKYGSNRHTNIPASYLLLEKDGKILMLLRQNTGYRDGMYSLVAGHVDAGENFTMALIREVKEEAGIVILPEDVRVVHVMHRKSSVDGSERVDVFHVVNKWQGEIINSEPEKCEKLEWFDFNKLPENTIPYIKYAILQISDGNFYSEFGWK